MADKLVFFSKSADAAPGKGQHEVAAPANYETLKAIKDWRRRLSNFDTSVTFEWIGEASLGISFPAGTRWRSLEHVFQGSKMALASAEAAALFAGEEPAVGPEGADAQKRRKAVMLNTTQLKRWDEIQDLVSAIESWALRVAV